MGIHLIIDYYTDARPDRREELLTSVRRNLSNPAVEAVYNLGSAEHLPPDDVVSHPKYASHPTDHRLTFRDAFSFANTHLAGRFVGVCNLDISLDPASDWSTAETLVRNDNLVLCQSRTECAADGSTHLDPVFEKVAYANAQDAWFWIAPFDPPNCDFELGTLGCDNAIADRIRKAGRIPANLASRFRILHLDLCRGKHGGNTNTVHRQEEQARSVVYSRFPEREGCYLLPDFDRVTSLDQLVAGLGLNPLQKYRVICDLMSQHIVIQN